MNQSHHLKLVFLFLLFHVFCFAQKIEYQFKILEVSGLNPIPFSTLRWGANSGTITDDQGFARFSAELEPTDTVFISCIGYSATKIPVKELTVSSINQVYLLQELFELTDVTIKAKKRKAQRSKQIIKEAISAIKENYAQDTYVSCGYFREYTKDRNTYINVFESIIDLQDAGFESNDRFKASLRYKRNNAQFITDSLLLMPYDNKNKFVPFSKMGIELNNELVILRAHDPIRNYNRYSFDYIGQLENDFIPNHSFSKPKISYLDEEPYYYIEFVDNIGFTYKSEVRFMAEGYLYINANDYGIKKINYKVNFDNYVKSKKLFEVNVDYKKQDDTYYLNYISFNNLFSYKRIKFDYQVIDTAINTISLHFNREVPIEFASKSSNYQVFLDEDKLECSEVNVTGKQVNLRVGNKKLKFDDTPEVNILWMKDANLSTHTDVFNAELDRKTYYQYREFFVRETQLDERLSGNYMDITRPVFQNEVMHKSGITDTSWMNTPFIEEEIELTMLTAANKEMLQSIVYQYKLNEANDNELIHMHADREIYAPGDTVWIKAYVQSKANLKASDKSSLLYLQLADEKGKVIEKSKFLVFNSAAKAQIKLDPKLEDGYYYLVAFSSWMKNFAPEDVCTKKMLVKNNAELQHRFIPFLNKSSFLPGDSVELGVRCFNNHNREVDDVSFNYIIQSGNTTITEGIGYVNKKNYEPIKFLVPPNQKKDLKFILNGNYNKEKLKTRENIRIIKAIDVDFFPEGGHCVQSQSINIAFKAASTDGEPVQIKGNIVDEKGNEIMEVASNEYGMGKFLFTPEKGHNYYLKLTEPEFNSDRFILPAAEKEGWNLSAKYTNSNLSIAIDKSNKHEKTALVTLQVRGHLYFHKLVTIKDNCEFEIPTSKFPMGIAVITLFDDQMYPRAERLLFINQEQANNVVLQTGAGMYGPRDSVHLKIKVRTPDGQPVSGSYSLSVFDDDLCSSPVIDENNIVSSLILSPEIKGDIFNPNYYSNIQDTTVMANLDLLLLCQGWRNYSYLHEINEHDSIPKPVDQDIISGQVLNEMNGNPMQSRVSVFYGMQSTDIFTNKDGKFSFKIEFHPANSPDISIYAKALSGNPDIELVLNSTKFEQQIKKSIPDLIDRERFSDQLQLTFKKLTSDLSLELENYKWIEEVTITSKRKNREKGDELFELPDLTTFSKSATKEQLKSSMEVFDVLLNMGLFVQRETEICEGIEYEVVKIRVDGRMENIHWYVNDVFFMIICDDYPKAFDYLNVSNILPDMIDRLTFVDGMEANNLYGNNFNAVVDIRFSPLFLKRSSGKSKVTIKNITVAKEFYSPRYSAEDKSIKIPDIRKTIHWEPNIHLDEDGEATVIFYNADRYSNIKCVLEGVSDEGIPGFEQTDYKVTYYK